METETEKTDRCRVTIVLPPNDADRLKEIATAKRSTISAVIREMVGAELDRMDADG